ncbi:MAG: hypothetical protein E7578_07650, partial [Ruminococcaceae bacterium]|nr:hypothetical protein [Oscillospiraceae bacterium]
MWRTAFSKKGFSAILLLKGVLMKKKILVWETLSTVSGGQKMTLTIMDILRDTYDFCCLIPGEGRMSEELDKRGIPYIIIGDQSLPTGVKGKSVIFRYAAMSLRCIRRSLKAIRQYKPDILYAPGPAALPWSAICGTLKRKPVIWHIHHVFLDGMTGKLLNICSKWKSVRKIIGVSAACTDQIKNEKTHEKIAVLYNPIDVERYRSGDAACVMPELTEKLGRVIDPLDTTVIGHIALIQRPKKQDITMRVMGNLKRQGRDVVGLFCGEVRDPEYMDELMKIALAEGIEDDVLFLGWRDDVPNIIKCMSVNFVPSDEGFSLI